MERPNIPENEAIRLAALRQTRLVESGRQHLFDNLTEIIKEVFGVPIVAITLIEETRQFFKSIQGLNITESPREISFCGHAVYQHSPLVVPDAKSDPRFYDNPYVEGAPFIRFYAGVPIEYEYKNQSYALGVLCLLDTSPRTLSDDELTLLKKFANQVERIIEACLLNATVINSAPLEKQNEFEKLVNDLLTQKALYKNLSEIDVLTNLPNRRHLFSFLNRHWFEDARSQLLSVLLIDLDGFKHINDTYGHTSGDKVLVDVSKEMSNVLRQSNDALTRIGGDEFLVVLIGIAVNDALKVAEKLLNAIAKVHTPDHSILTASIGVVSIEDKALSLEEIIERADLAMYIAKLEGKAEIYFRPES